ncbi:wall-associated receptor kinase-like 14 [Salvia miltiorrhiza]|uniref:wall-associated receptor kinase-like 14 n=1 Tax=Salvia miltiorrhiza TaxID=226208 RepID=UPI0025AD3277|nr:wall-associated receptor kinase-like 14 [Salvia miltiorrhiza]
MILDFLQTILPLLLSISILSLPSSALDINSTSCNRNCGGNTVQYPFGFSDGCGIKLKCGSNSSTIQIGGFDVHNVTSDHILVSIPAKCDRQIDDLVQLFGSNFAPTWRNGLLLENCSEPMNDCVVPRRLVRSTIGLKDCERGEENGDRITCYSVGSNDSTEFLDYETVKETGSCRFLLSSILVGNATQSSSIALDFQKVELGWWVDGGCHEVCDPNAECTEVHYKGKSGHRCKCKHGYVGDGFRAGGVGCRKEVGNCHATSLSIRCGGTKVGILVGGIVAGASLVVVLAVIYYCVKNRATSLKNKLSARRMISEAAGNSSVPLYTYKDIERATNSFSEKQRLGIGAYGTVYAGKLHNDELVAIKKIRYRDHESVDQVMNEIKLLSSVSHQNLVRLLGCCIENGEQILVYEYMANGTLSQHLQRERGSVLPWTIRLTIAAETAHAISHLHSAMNPPIYHRDIKSSNILLDYNFNSKVADFGLSRFGMTDDSHISTAPQGTPGYLDPQYHQNFHLSDKSDVYSFGVVLVEIITAMKVVDFSRSHSEINLAALAIDRIGKGRIDEIVDPFLEPNRDAWTLSSIHKVAELAFRCLAFHRDMRPSMMEVADELEQIRLSGWAPMEETMHMGSSVASTCSSPYQGSEKSFNTSKAKKTTTTAIIGVGSRRLVVSQRAAAAAVATEEVKNNSPVSVQDPWLSQQSSPSTNSLLSNVVR